MTTPQALYMLIPNKEINCPSIMEFKNPSNKDLGKTKITDKIRVSSAAIWYELEGRYQYETFIFSDDKGRQKSTQIIHGSAFSSTGSEKLERVTKKIHKYVSDNLIEKFDHRYYLQSLISEAQKDKIILVNILYREHKKGDKRIMELVKKVNGPGIIYEYEHFLNAAQSLTENKKS